MNFWKWLSIIYFVGSIGGFFAIHLYKKWRTRRALKMLAKGLAPYLNTPPVKWFDLNEHP